ncbi:hypothetical protein [Paracoccus aminophilus]|uniref:VanZ-like domain-containing protein n=1 Tax=Paracoccus aminophilus JCM 7686 TaxID=1367847 RepID=S5YW48_PARAH|nr:hypothetical protein [Paracoccus aminophilus]AGT09461.1 hypothetical protein JCM7686_2393 [Paracoccus aminophilus JCM 7686]
MIRELLTPEDHADPYAWAAVFVAHAAIGVALWALLAGLTRRPLLWAGLLYAAFEALQATVAGELLFWDSALDWTGVMLGAALASSLWAQRLGRASAAIIAALAIAVAGWRKRE